VAATPSQAVAPFAKVEKIAAQSINGAEDGGAGRSAVSVLQTGRCALKCSQLPCTELEGRWASH
jgi:hypothetical protein